MKEVVGCEQAISILRGAGVKVDTKNRTQTWKFGKIYSDKVVKAGSFLDKYNLATNEEYKTVWLDKNGELPVWKKKEDSK